MKKLKWLGLAAAVAGVFSCTTNPLTGRKSLQLVNNDQIIAMSLQEYKQALAAGKVISGTAGANQVNTVGNRIKNAAENYYRSIGRADALANYAWEFRLMEDKQVNAWCMPGGKVVVYSGILPISQTDTGLAVVLGHEISHALAGHGNERISQQMVAQYGGSILGATISNAQIANIFQQVYPTVGGLGLLAYGRKQELEADQEGLYLMAMAGYNPNEAKNFWARMEAASNGNRPPEFLSTHPSPENRRADIDKNLPKAMEYYNAARR